MASPASAATPGSEDGGAARYAGQKSVRSATVPVCYRPGELVPVNVGGTSTPNSGQTGPAGPTTCYALSYQYDPGASTWWPSLGPPCEPGPGTPLAERIDGFDHGNDWFRNDDDDWFGDKGRRFDDLIIGSVTIGIGGPTVGGTGIVGGTGNTAGGTTAGFGGVTAGGTTVGGFGNTATNSGTTITAPVLAGGLADTTGAPTLPEGPSFTDTGLPTCGSTVAPGEGEPSLVPSEQTTFAPPSSYDYQRGWWEGWAARGQQDGAAVASLDDLAPFGGSAPADEPSDDLDNVVSAS